MEQKVEFSFHETMSKLTIICKIIEKIIEG